MEHRRPPKNTPCKAACFIYHALNFLINLGRLNGGNRLAKTRSKPTGAMLSLKLYSWNCPKMELFVPLAQTLSDSIQRLLTWCFRLSGCQFWLFSISHIFLLLLKHCFWINTSHSCHGGRSIQIMVSTFCIYFLAKYTSFSSFLCCKLLYRSYTVQCFYSLDTVSSQARCVFIRNKISLCVAVSGCPIFVLQQWWKLFFPSIDHSIFSGIYCCMRCWMLQDMDHMEASCLFNVEVGIYDQIEQSQISVSTVTTLGIEMQTVEHDMIQSLWVMQVQGEFLR